jgi:CDGSH-type Zn-finger protein
MSTDRPTIEVSEHGPYIVHGTIVVQRADIARDENNKAAEWVEGAVLSNEPDVYLCRCGQSKNKPFCDDSHLSAAFDGTETASREPFAVQAERIVGPALTMLNAVPLCASAGFCTRHIGIKALTAASDDADSRAVAIREAIDCPSGRYVAIDPATDTPIEDESAPVILVTQDPAKGVSGPLFVKGGVQLHSHDGTTYEVRARMALCRCGRSGNKPFCDGRHYVARFNDGTVTATT